MCLLLCILFHCVYLSPRPVFFWLGVVLPELLETGVFLTRSGFARVFFDRCFLAPSGFAIVLFDRCFSTGVIRPQFFLPAALAVRLARRLVRRRIAASAMSHRTCELTARLADPPTLPFCLSLPGGNEPPREIPLFGRAALKKGPRLPPGALPCALRVDGRKNCVFNMASINVCELCGAHFYSNLKQQNAVVQKNIIKLHLVRQPVTMTSGFRLGVSPLVRMF